MSNHALEKELILLAVLKNRSNAENNRIEEIAANELDWGWIGGQLLHHRLTGYFVIGLGPLAEQLMHEEFSKALELIMKSQAQQLAETNQIILPILKQFEESGIPYAALKGLVFNASLYEPGERRSNDSDILVMEDDLDRLDAILRKNGYIQSNRPNGEFKEASRKEKMIQRMNYHDLVPYVKQIDAVFMKIHEIDINFHMDSKDNDITKKVFMLGTERYKNGHYEVKGLPWETHLAQLCIHFCREGTSSIWSSGRRDVVLYKIVDIANTVRLAKDEEHLFQWISLMKQLSLDKACYYTLHYIAQFYPQLLSLQMLATVRPDDTAYLDEIAIAGEDRIVKRQSAFIDTAFNLTYKK
ncbi:nucleotidyltransferase family protein [Paenibacillus cymbidii]|uniref:nucleotidyltransferase family protein n=1 Tax=Paenibacillus cymbidii TaxID=1639034 RepID=UPI0010813B81|nr:nucleotidyltransferase family protein [Paenibacillus cymbidii]